MGKRSFSVAVLAREGRGGGELPVAIALDLVLVLWVCDKGAETLVLAAKGSWWVMRAPGAVDRALGLRVWGCGF